MAARISQAAVFKIEGSKWKGQNKPYYSKPAPLRQGGGNIRQSFIRTLALARRHGFTDHIAMPFYQAGRNLEGGKASSKLGLLYELLRRGNKIPIVIREERTKIRDPSISR